MNYDEPRQIKEGDFAGRWLFTTYNRRTGTHAIGYCAEGCDGHDTEEEARKHYHEYQLDQLEFSDGPEDPDILHRCQSKDCTEYTAGSAKIGWHLVWYLCSEHRNRESVGVLYSRANDSIHS